MDGEIIGQMWAVEFVEAGEQREDDERKPGTYVTIRVPPGTSWTAGTVIVRYARDAQEENKK